MTQRSSLSRDNSSSHVINVCRSAYPLKPGLFSCTVVVSMESAYIIDCLCADSPQGLPPEIGRLTALQRLELSGLTGLRQLPDAIGSLTQLTSVCCWQSELRHIPDSFTQLAQLRQVFIHRISGTRTSEPVQLPRSWGNLRQLRIIALDNLGLTSVPDLHGLTDLTRLRLTSKAFTAADALRGISDSTLSALNVLELADCKLPGLSSDLTTALTQLTQLGLRGNLMTENPCAALAQLVGLRFLSLPVLKHPIVCSLDVLEPLLTLEHLEVLDVVGTCIETLYMAALMRFVSRHSERWPSRPRLRLVLPEATGFWRRCWESSSSSESDVSDDEE